MLNEELKKKYSPLQDEIYRLFIGTYSYNRKLELFPKRINNDSRFFIIEESIALRMMCNEIILHLCKLDDDSSNFSFRSAMKEINKISGQQSKKNILNKKIKEYRKNINIIKTKHRNLYIAHKNEDCYPEQFDLPDYKSDFHHFIKQAYDIFTIIWGSEVNFGFKVGSQEKYLNFIEELDLK